MKQIQALLFLVCVVLLTGCTDLDVEDKRHDKIEAIVNSMQEALNEGKIISKIEALDNQDGWFITFTDNTTITLDNSFFKYVQVDNGFVTFAMSDGTSFTFNMESPVIEPRLLGMVFLAKDNSMELIEDAVCNIVGDSIIDCWIPGLMESKQLIANISFEGDKVVIGEEEFTDGVLHCDFKTPVKLEVKSGELRKEYIVYVHSFTGIPVLWIETENRAEIVSKDEYLKAHFKLVEDVVTRSAGDVVEADGQIKGRGNSTWSLPKKPYRLKFGEKVSFLDEPKDKSWVLLANYCDKTSVRNATAFYIGEISNLEYTPRFHFVDVILNGRYNGTYQLGDKLKISKDRVNIGDDGFLIEIDNRAYNESDARYFKIRHIENPLNIKEPDVEYDDENYLYAKEYLTNVDNVLFGDNFSDLNEGWQKYLDIESFVDWYLINEIVKNNDAIFYSSCYMNLSRNGKLKMGPLWDFDTAFGNINYNNNYDIEGFWIKKVMWYTRLFEDPIFVDKVKERFNYFYSRKNDILNEINQNASYLKYSVQENENRWNTLYNNTWPNYNIWGSYMNEIQSMKTWLSARFEWLKSEFDKM